jgi:hypothetical protein
MTRVVIPGAAMGTSTALSGGRGGPRSSTQAWRKVSAASRHFRVSVHPAGTL